MEKATVKIAPSILAAHFARLGQQVAEAEQGGADRIHVDVMDGHFVPESVYGFGDRGVPSASHATAPRDPSDDLGPGLFSGRVCRGRLRLVPRPLGGQQQSAPHGAADQDAGKRVAVDINPATPSAVLEEIVHDLDQVLVMTVNPGFGHQQFIRTTLPKIERVRELTEGHKPGCDVEVDGGIDATTAPLVVRAGATVLVAGSAIFGDREGVVAAMKRLRTALDHTAPSSV